MLFSASVLGILGYALLWASPLDITGAVTLIASVVSLIVSILELARIITKYCFPENDEEYIVKIVESIQDNALEKLKETNRAAEARSESQDNNK